MSEQKVLIDCRDAALGYEGRPIWEHLTFQVRRGDYLCIVGDNGSGKSTLLKSMLGLLRPLSGEIRLDESRPPGGHRLSAPADPGTEGLSRHRQ